MIFHSRTRRNTTCLLPLILSLGLLLTGCSDPPSGPEPAASIEPDPYEQARNTSHQEVVSNEPFISLPETPNRLEAYRVVLGADETIRMPGTPGELRVWIGGHDHHPDFPEDMVEDETTVPAVGDSAKVQPFAPGFEIRPEETQCILIHPSGSEVRFTLIPLDHGVFEVGANVLFFGSPDCTGSPIPKTATTLKVQVDVDPWRILIGKALQLWDVLWEQFVEFWAALVAIFFGVLLFLIRGRLKKWFDYGDK